jgi:hypothetical protein
MQPGEKPELKPVNNPNVKSYKNAKKTYITCIVKIREYFLRIYKDTSLDEKV